MSNCGDEINPLHRDILYHHWDRFHQNGNVVDLPQLGRPHRARTQETVQSIKEQNTLRFQLQCARRNKNIHMQLLSRLIGRSTFGYGQKKAGKVLFTFTKVACTPKLFQKDSNLKQCESKSAVGPNNK